VPRSGVCDMEHCNLIVFFKSYMVLDDFV
jgi:hypothetical protein